jgi:AAA+ superfamily predicted ATPase
MENIPVPPDPFNQNTDIIKIHQHCESLNYLISFQIDYSITMIHNLSSMNSIKLYQDYNFLYMSILDELIIIKKEIDKYQELISLTDINSSDNYKQQLIKINDLLIKYSNHIASDNLNYIFKLLIGEDWVNHFSKTDLEQILFLNHFIKPISVWDSEFHKEKIPFAQTTNNDNSKEKSFVVTKEIINSLLGIKSKEQEEPKNINTIIVNNSESQLPGFLKTINDIIGINQIKNSSRYINHFDKDECINMLLCGNIKITKNIKSLTLIEDKMGVCIYINVKNKIIVIQGLFKDDLLNISNSIKFVKNNYISHKSYLEYNILEVPIAFKNNYIKIINLRDIIVCTSSELGNEIKKKYNDFKLIQNKPLLTLINEFLLASKFRKIDILTLLLMSNEEDKNLACILFDIFKSKDKKDISSDIYNSLHYTIRGILDISTVNLENNDLELSKITDSDIPYERRISLINTSIDVKTKAMEKLKAIKSNFQGDSKAQSWLDGLLKIPFGVYSQNEIINFKEQFISKLKLISPQEKLFSDNDIDNYIKKRSLTNIASRLIITEWNNYKIDKKKYLQDIRKTLDSAVYGHKDAKLQLERIFAQWINGSAKGAILGLQGPPGTGKTSLAKNGLSNCLKDKSGKVRPFIFLPIGGSVNGSTLVGHSFTYVGSTWGRIVDSLMVAECMDPIIFIDEVDKVSSTDYGREIISILTHLTDSTQNDEFEDKFFSGIKLDLSRALIVFSFNDPNLIDPILRDRITIIETHPLSLQEKITIIKDYMFPEICKEVGFNQSEIILNDDIITFLIETYTNEAGVRKIKEKVVELVRDINLNRFHSDEFQIPFTINKEYIHQLFENKPKVKVKKIHSEPAVGLVNGLYATSSGLGGITVIQAIKFPSSKILDIELTGKAGDVMKESVQYSLKVAWGLLTKEEQDIIIEDSNNKKSFGIHIHCPDGATPKDGPSAGLAFTLAIYSLLTGKKVNNKICMTGEVDLQGHAGIIGGLESKLPGGKKAGCTLALIPKDNMEDLERMRREGLSPEDDNFKVLSVTNIKEILLHALV